MTMLPSEGWSQWLIRGNGGVSKDWFFTIRALLSISCLVWMRSPEQGRPHHNGAGYDGWKTVDHDFRPWMQLGFRQAKLVPKSNGTAVRFALSCTASGIIDRFQDILSREEKDTTGYRDMLCELKALVENSEGELLGRR